MSRVLNCLSLEHDWRLVVLAGVVCFLASLTAISLFHRASALKGRARLTWLLIAGLATGCGMWATHFIAMLAFKPGFAVSYDLFLTVLSLLVAIAASVLGFAWAVYGTWRWRAAVGGAVIGLAAAAMHFIGMNSLEMPGYIVWSAGLVAAAILLGAAFGAAALTLASRGDGPADFIGGSLLIATAIVTLHFTAMGAAGIVHDSTYRLLGANSLSPEWMAVAIAAVAGSVLAMCFAGAIADRHTRRAINEQNSRLDSALNNMNQGLCMFDADNSLVVWNQRYVDMYRIDPKRIWLGCTMRDLLDARIAAGTFPLDPARYEARIARRAQAGQVVHPQHRARRRPHHRGGQPAVAGRRLGGDARGHHRAEARRARSGAHPRLP